MTIRDAIRDGAAQLEERGRASPWLDASLLLGAVLGMDKARLLASYPDGLAPAAAESFASLVGRRAEGEPVAYILGHKEFRGLDFVVGSSVLIPRPETEILVERALALAAEDAAGGRPADGPYLVHDACAGSGCVGIALALELPAALGGCPVSVELSDLSAEALAIAARNAERLLGRSLPAFRMDFLEGLPPRSRDLVVANPPYLGKAEMASLQAEARREPSLALSGGADGLDPLRALAPRAAAALREGGAFAAEIGSGQAAAAAGILLGAGFSRVELDRDLAGLDRVVSGRLHG